MSTLTKSWILIFVALAVISPTLYSAGGEIGESVVIGKAVGSDPVSPAAGMSENGNLVTAWRKEDGAGKFEIHVQRLSPNNNPLGPPDVIASASMLSNPKLAVASDGSYAVGFSTNSGAFLALYSDNGFEYFQRRVFLSGSVTEFEDVAMDDEKNIHAVYCTGIGTVRVHSIDSEGELTFATIADPDAGGQCSEARIAVQADGSYAVCYRDDDGIRGRVFNVDRTVRTDAFWDGGLQFGTATSHDITVIGGGGYVVGAVSSRHQLFIARTRLAEPLGVHWTHTQQLYSIPDHLSLGSDASGNLIAAWDETGSDGSHTAYAQRFFPGGSAADQRVVLRRSLESSRPVAAVHFSGHAAVVFDEKALSFGIPLPPPLRNVVGQRFEPLPDQFCNVAIPSEGIDQSDVAQFSDFTSHPDTALTVGAFGYGPAGAHRLAFQSGSQSQIEIAGPLGTPFYPKVVMPTPTEAIVVWSGDGTLSGQRFELDQLTGEATVASGVVELYPFDVYSSEFDLATNGNGIVNLAYQVGQMSYRIGILSSDLTHFQVNETSLSEEIYGLSIDVNASRKVAMIYYQFTPTPRVYAQSFNLLISPLSAPVRIDAVSDQTISLTQSPNLDVALSDDGTALAIWAQSKTVSTGSVLDTFASTVAQRVTTDGTLLGHNTVVGTGLGATGATQRALALTDGSFSIALNFPVRILRYTGNGNPVSFPSFVEDSPNILVGFGEMVGEDLAVFGRSGPVKKFVLANGSKYWLDPRVEESGELKLTSPGLPGYNLRYDNSFDLRSWFVGGVVSANASGSYEVSSNYPQLRERAFFRFTLIPRD